jgi:exonuclease SbcC
MIELFETKNFQSHKSTLIEFDKGVNVIVGTNDSGKSAIFRSLHWLFLNRPLGETFKNWNASKKEVVYSGVQFNDSWISKERKNNKNLYYLESLPEDTPLEAFKAELPEEVLSITKITDINLQGQHDRYFLLQDSAGEVARKFNEIVGLDIIDKMFKWFNSKISTYRGKDTEYDSKINDLNTQIEQRAFLDEIKPIVDKLESSIAEEEKIKIKAERIRNLIENYHKIEEEIILCKVDPDFEKRINSILDKIKQFKEKEKERNKLLNFIDTYNKLNNSLKEMPDWSPAEVIIKAILHNIVKYDSLVKQREKIKGIIFSHQTIERNLSKAKEQLATNEIEEKTLWGKAKICPLCKRSL